jgi:hypothetical protein
MSIELIKFNQYGERFGSRNVDEDIKKADMIKHFLPEMSEVLFETKDKPYVISRALTAISTNTVQEIVSTVKPDSDGMPISKVIYHNTYQGEQINESSLAIKAPTGERVLYHYSPDKA